MVEDTELCDVSIQKSDDRPTTYAAPRYMREL